MKLKVAEMASIINSTGFTHKLPTTKPETTQLLVNLLQIAQKYYQSVETAIKPVELQPEPAADAVVQLKKRIVSYQQQTQNQISQIFNLLKTFNPYFKPTQISHTTTDNEQKEEHSDDDQETDNTQTNLLQATQTSLHFDHAQSPPKHISKSSTYNFIGDMIINFAHANTIPNISTSQNTSTPVPYNIILPT